MLQNVMSIVRVRCKLDWPFLSLVLFFMGITGLFSCIWFAHYINPDATSYFTIAQKYASFDVAHAINGYWGPLFSWLLVPAVWVGIGLDVAARLILVLGGAGILVLVYSFFRTRLASRMLSTVMCVPLAVVLFVWITLGAVTPDLLFAFFAVLCVVLLERFLMEPSSRLGVSIGLVGALLYFTKGFGFYLFLALAGTVALWQWLRAKPQKRAATAKRYIPIFVVFAAVTVPFIVLLSIKYNAPTISTTGSYVHRAFGPEVQGHHPTLTRGPLAPPNNSASSVWEDPTLTTHLMPDWSPLDSRARMHYFVRDIIWHNLDNSLQSIMDAGAFIAWGTLLVILGCFGRTFKREYILLTMLAMFVVTGYALVLTEPRYLWSITIIAFLAIGLWAISLEKKYLLSRWQLPIGCTVVTVLMLMPLPAQVTAARKAAALEHRQIADVGRYIPSHSKVIAGDFSVYYPCYYVHLQCYAILENPSTGAVSAYVKRLKQEGVAYYIDYYKRVGDAQFSSFLDSSFIKIGDIYAEGSHSPAPPIATIYRLR